MVPVEPEPVGPVQVALLLPLTGRAQDVGQDMLSAAQLALHSVGPTDIVFRPIDTGSTTDGARVAVQRAIDDGAELILGPLFGASTAAVAPIARDAQIPVISFSNDASVAGDGIFVTGFRPEEQVRRVIDFAQRQGYVRIAALGPADAYGERSVTAWRDSVLPGNDAVARLYAANENGMAGSVRDVADYDARKAERDREFALVEGLDDPASLARKSELETLDTIGDPPFDALLIADGGDRLRSVVALLAYYDVDPQFVKLLGTMQWQGDPRALAEEGLDGAWFASLPPAEREAFESNFTFFFDKMPHPVAGLAYDATVMASELARIDRKFPNSLLTDPAGFSGHAGTFRLLDDGTAEHSLAIVELIDGQLSLLEPAPRSFGDAILSQ